MKLRLSLILLASPLAAQIVVAKLPKPCQINLLYALTTAPTGQNLFQCNKQATGFIQIGFPQIQINGKQIPPVRPSINFTFPQDQPTGISYSCVDNPVNSSTDCQWSVNSAVYASRDILMSDACSYVKSTNGTTAYTYSFGLACKALTAYREGQTFTLWVDSDCVASCSLDIDNLGSVAIKLADTTTDPGGALKAGQVQSVTYTPVIGVPGQFVFVLRP